MHVSSCLATPPTSASVLERAIMDHENDAHAAHAAPLLLPTLLLPRLFSSLLTPVSNTIKPWPRHGYPPSTRPIHTHHPHRRTPPTQVRQLQNTALEKYTYSLALLTSSYIPSPINAHTRQLLSRTLRINPQSSILLVTNALTSTTTLA